MKTYIGMLRKDQGRGYSVDFPDFPSCITEGGTVIEVHSLAAKALKIHVEKMREAGCEIPRPSTFPTVMADSHNRDIDAIFVTV
jgi:predicted RNase H-like HicB family nuclease